MMGVATMAVVVVLLLLALVGSAVPAVAGLERLDVKTDLSGRDTWTQSVSYRCQQWPSRKNDTCYPGNRVGGRCFRRVVDSPMSPELAQSIMAKAQQHREDALLFDIQRHHPEVLSSVQAIVAEEAELNVSHLTLAHARVESGTSASTGFDECDLHADYATSSQYPLAAFVFLNTMDRDAAGGEHAFIDEAAFDPLWQEATRRGETHHISSGVLVEPKLGRTVVFSGGFENSNCRMPLKHGSRHVLQLWFTCSSASSQSAASSSE